MTRRIRTREWACSWAGLKHLLLPLAVLTLLSPPLYAAPLFGDIIVFGDSLSDVGNTEVVAPGGDIPNTDFTYGSNGRFTNDRVWAEFLGERLGLGETLLASRKGGTNYAHGGAVLNFDSGPSTGVLRQYQQWRSTAGSDGAATDALYIVWAGANDLRAGMMMPGLDLGAYVNDRLTAYATLLADLIDAGAQSILVPNLPNLGYAPEAQLAGVADQVSALVTFWNAGLDDVLDTLTTASDVTFYRADIFSAIEQVFNDPAAHGLTNVTDACSHVLNNVEIACANPEQYAFWDTLHPTSTAHRLFAEVAYNAITQAQPVPVPASFWLLLAGVGMLIRRGCWASCVSPTYRSGRWVNSPSSSRRRGSSIGGTGIPACAGMTKESPE